MKAVQLLPLATLATAFVLPTEQVLGELTIEDHHQNGRPSYFDEIVEVKEDVVSRVKDWFGQAEQLTEDVFEVKDDIASRVTDWFGEAQEASELAWTKAAHCTKNVWEDAFERASETFDDVQEDALTWFEEFEMDGPSHDGPPPPPPPHGPPPPPHGPPHHKPPHHGPPHHGKPHHGKPHHGHHGPPNETVWQLISSSKYTTKLAKLISEYDDLVDALNSTKANYTLFAPTDSAFAKIPEHVPKPTKEQLKAILSYHVVDGFYPAGRVLATHTAPTLLKSESLGSEPEPQRVVFKLSLRGLTVNFRSRVIAINIFGTNGVIHGIDTIIIPPPKGLDILSFFPGEFSTLDLGLAKTGLFEKLNTTKHNGGTIFAPSNFAFKKLGPRINAFLFSSAGEKYLKALLEYHIVPGVTLYSDAIYTSKKSDAELSDSGKGLFHIELPTLLKDRTLSVDIARFGGFITIKINGFSSVALQDVVAKDGVIHVVRNVLIPPKKLGSTEEDLDEEMSVEDFCERLEPYLGKHDL